MEFLIAKEDYSICSLIGIIYAYGLITDLGKTVSRSEDPNCMVQRDTKGRKWLYSIKEIKEGDPITIRKDYIIES